METIYVNMTAIAAPKPIRVRYRDGTTKEFDYPALGDKDGVNLGPEHLIERIEHTYSTGDCAVSLGTVGE